MADVQVTENQKKDLQKAFHKKRVSPAKKATNRKPNPKDRRLVGWTWCAICGDWMPPTHLRRDIPGKAGSPIKCNKCGNKLDPTLRIQSHGKPNAKNPLTGKDNVPDVVENTGFDSKNLQDALKGVAAQSIEEESKEVAQASLKEMQSFFMDKTKKIKELSEKLKSLNNFKRNLEDYDPKPLYNVSLHFRDMNEENNIGFTLPLHVNQVEQFVTDLQNHTTGELESWCEEVEGTLEETDLYG